MSHAKRKIFVVSDLHLGGRPDERNHDGELTRLGFQICNAYAELVDFIDWLAEGHAVESPDYEIELVINGDIVDFLADDDYCRPEIGTQVWTANQEHAVLKLEKVLERTEEGIEKGGVFGALRRLLTAGHRLTLILGNHDVELALPTVRDRLIQELGGKSRHLQLVYDGEAYTVGKLLIEHGNRYDNWNMVDHSRIRQERTMCSRGLKVDEDLRGERYFVAPPGTHLVIHFMNRIKSRFRFVDLLKPETSVVVPLLLELEPKRRRFIREILRAVRVVAASHKHGLAEPAMPKVPGDMAAHDAVEDEHPELNDVLRSVLKENAEPFLATSTAGDMGLSDRVYDSKRWLATKLDAWKETGESLSHWVKAAVSSEDEVERRRRLLIALQQLNWNDTSFNPSAEESKYLEAARETARQGGFEVVVYGHTHLPKALRGEAVAAEEDHPRTFSYFNTGTWCDVMRLPPEVELGGEAEAAAALDTFIDALKANDFGRYIQRYLSFVEVAVSSDGSVTSADLFSYCGRGRERCSPLTGAL